MMAWGVFMIIVAIEVVAVTGVALWNARFDEGLEGRRIDVTTLWLGLAMCGLFDLSVIVLRYMGEIINN